MANKVTAKDLMDDQQKRLQRQKQKEIYDNFHQDAKLRFKRKPYYLYEAAKKEDKCDYGK